MQAHEILEAGARHIEANGLCKQGFGWPESATCMMGAMRVAVHGRITYPLEGAEEYHFALEELAGVCQAEFPAVEVPGNELDNAFGRVALTNDSDDVDSRQAIALMEKAATNLRP